MENDFPFSLNAGYNTDSIDGDEVNGPGTNWAIWPTLMDTYEPCTTMILTSDAMAVFDTCADYIPPHDNWVVNILSDDNSVTIQRAA